MDREERAAINNSVANTSPHNCSLRLATAFTKGTKNTLATFTEPPHITFIHIADSGVTICIGITLIV